MAYCTVEQVINVVRIYENDWDDQINTLPTELIEGFIAEATEEINYILYTRYELSIIAALSPVPYAINFLTKVRTAFLLLDRIGPVSSDRSKALKDLLQHDYDHWYLLVERGLLLDSTGTAVVTKDVRTPDTQTPAFVNNISNLYFGLPPGQYRRY